MEKMSRNIGMALSVFLDKRGISVSEAAKIIDYSFRDLRRIIEGRLFVSPKELERISEKLDTTPEYLITFKPTDKCLLPDLEYNKEFSDVDNLYKIIDYIDEYIELREQM